MDKMLKKIIDVLVQKNAIKEKEKELYLFGLSYLTLSLLNICTILFIGCISGKLFESIIFISCIVIIRSYSGGYHSDSAFICYLISLLSIIIALMFIETIALDVNISIVMIALSMILIMFLSPVGNKNKPLDLVEKRVYKRKAIRNVLMLFIVGLIFRHYDCYKYLQIESCAFLISTILLIVGTKMNSGVYIKT